MCDDRGSADRFARFFEAELKHEWKQAQAIQKLHGGTVPSDVMDALRKRFDAVAANVTNHDRIADKAKETGRSHVYELAYAECCGASHSGAEGLRYFYQESAEGHVTIRLGRHLLSPRPVVIAASAYLLLLATTMDLCSVVDRFESQQTALGVELTKLLDEDGVPSSV